MMNRFRRILLLGFTSIWRHRLRSSLTVLGIVFGVCSVIAMLAIGEGASHEAQEQIKRLGSENIILRSVKPPQSDSARRETSFVLEYGLTHADLARLREAIPDVEMIVPLRSIRTEALYRTRRLDVNVIGAPPEYLEIANQRIVQGRFITSDDMTRVATVCVVSEPLAQRLFMHIDPLGEVIRVSDQYYRIVGIMEGSGVMDGAGGESGDPFSVFVPLTAARQRFGEVIVNRTSGSFSSEKVELHQIIVRTAGTDVVFRNAEMIGALLQRFHRDMDYVVMVPLELLRQAQHTRLIFNVVLGSIAAISLLVGGIGIMNIMLASVTERTREIGIRRAIGARRRDVLTQFLTETVLLSGSGGVIGLIIGISTPLLITHFSGMTTIVRLWALSGAFGISLLLGIVFGMYPAWRAANMNPIQALRHE